MWFTLAVLVLLQVPVLILLMHIDVEFDARLSIEMNSSRTLLRPVSFLSRCASITIKSILHGVQALYKWLHCYEHPSYASKHCYRVIAKQYAAG